MVINTLIVRNEFFLKNCLTQLFVLIGLITYCQEPHPAFFYLDTRMNIDTIKLYGIDGNYIIDESIHFRGFHQARDFSEDYHKIQLKKKKFKLVGSKDSVSINEYFTDARPVLGLVCIHLIKKKQSQYIYIYSDEFKFKEKENRRDFFRILLMNINFRQGTYFFDFERNNEKLDSLHPKIGLEEFVPDEFLFRISDFQLPYHRISNEAISPEKLVGELKKKNIPKELKKMYQPFQFYK